MKVNGRRPLCQSLPFNTSGLALHACLALQQAFMDALSMIMPIRLTPGPALAHVFVDVLAPCMLPVRVATSVVLGATQNSAESF